MAKNTKTKKKEFKASPLMEAIVELFQKRRTNSLGNTPEQEAKAVKEIAEKWNVDLGIIAQFVNPVGGLDMEMRTSDLSSKTRTYGKFEDEFLSKFHHAMKLDESVVDKSLDGLAPNLVRTAAAIKFRISSLRKSGEYEKYKLEDSKEGKKILALVLPQEEKEENGVLSVIKAYEEASATSETAIIETVEPETAVVKVAETDLIDDLGHIIQNDNLLGNDAETIFNAMANLMKAAKIGTSKELEDELLEKIATLEERVLELEEENQDLHSKLTTSKQEEECHRVKLSRIEEELYYYEKLTPRDKILELKDSKKRVKGIIHKDGTVDVKA